MPELPQTRQSLLIRLQSSNDEGAWHEFVDVYEQAIYSYARSRGLQDADAWDVTQEVLSAVEKKVATWNADPKLGAFRGWLFRVARNIAVDKIKAQSRRAIVSGDSQADDALQQHPENAEEETTLFWNNYRRKLLHWVAKKIKADFQEASWQAFWATAVEGRSAESVAKDLGLSTGSVYAAKFRSVKRIREVVSNLDDSECDDRMLTELEQSDS